MSSALGNIECTPTSPMVCETVLIEVKPANADGFEPAFEQTIRINGVPGTHTYLQFLAPGTRTILIQANAPSGPVSKTLEIKITGPEATDPNLHAIQPERFWPLIGLPLLQMYHELPQPSVVGFAVGQTSGSMSQPLSVGTIQPLSLAPKFEPLSHLPPLGTPPPNAEVAYEWDFGDGTKFGSTNPAIQHDYSNALDPLVEHQNFDVSVSGGGRKVTRTLTFTNLYAMLKRTHDILHPQAKPTGFASRNANGFEGSFTVYNPEAYNLFLLNRRFVPLSSDSSSPVTPSFVEHQGGFLEIPSKNSRTVQVFARFDQVPRDSIGFSVYYSGAAAGDKHVRVNVHFDLTPSQQPRLQTPSWEGPSRSLLASIQETLTRSKLTGASLSQMRNMKLPDGFFADREALSNDTHMLRTGNLIPLAAKPPDSVLLPTLRQIPGLHLPSTNLLPPGGLHLEDAPAVAIGVECDPDNLLDALPPGFVCQATNESRLHQTQARFRNAWRGHTVLAPGAVGDIGQLLTKVDTVQLYSHCGIMTNNFEQITHCTASNDRLTAYPVGSIPLEGTEPTHGFRPDTIKYGWPGTITQTVANCINGSNLSDPEGGKNYTFADFNAFPQGAEINQKWHVIPPLVVKPDPMLDNDSLTEKLHTVANDAYAHNGLHHYRFFCYTDPTIVDRDASFAPKNNPPKWQDGTHPAVCSSFIWSMMKRNGMHLAGAGPTVQPSDLTDAQKHMGAKIGSSTPDGLYLYQAAERLRAANFLDDLVKGKVAAAEPSGLSGFINFFSKISTHVSNEFVNAFARDIVGLDDDDDGWKNTVDANAVSPDDILKWNGPLAPTPGPYGYTEPIVYTELRWDVVTVNKWVQVQLKGSLVGIVTFNGAPVAGATVSIGGNMTSNCDSNGHYSIGNVPLGHYTASAQHTDASTGQMISGSVPVDVESDNAAFNIPLSLPPAVFRHVLIAGFTHIHYTKHVIFKVTDHQQDFQFQGDMAVDPRDTHKEFSFPATLDSANTNLVVKVDWRADHGINVHVDFRLHDKVTSADAVIPQDGVHAFGRPGQAEIELDRDNDQAWPIFTVSNLIAQG